MKKILKVIGCSIFIVALEVGLFSLPLPFSPGISGLIPGFFITIFIWLIIYALALLYAEALQNLPPNSNFFSLFEHYFGSTVKWIFCIPFLFFTLSLLFSYLVFALPLAQDFFCSIFSIEIPFFFLILLILLVTGVFLFLGLTPTIIFSSLLTLGLFVPLYYLTTESLPLIDPSQFFFSNWKASFYSIPIIYGAIYFPYFVPTLYDYLERDKKAFKLVLFLGLTSTLVIYLLIELLVRGSFSEDDFWLSSKSLSITPFDLSIIKKTEPFTRWYPTFYFFAIYTSLIGYGYILFDILFDAAQIRKEDRSNKIRLYMILLVLVPPGVAALFVPSFFGALKDNLFHFYQLILSLFFIFTLWSIRYHSKLSLPRLLPDGKPLLALLFLAVIFLLWFQGIAFIQQVG